MQTCLPRRAPTREPPPHCPFPHKGSPDTHPMSPVHPKPLPTPQGLTCATRGSSHHPTAGHPGPCAPNHPPCPMSHAVGPLTSHSSVPHTPHPHPMLREHPGAPHMPLQGTSFSPVSPQPVSTCIPGPPHPTTAHPISPTRTLTPCHAWICVTPPGTRIPLSPRTSFAAPASESWRFRDSGGMAVGEAAPAELPRGRVQPPKISWGSKSA